MRYLKELDQFSVHYQQYIYKGQNQHKSIFGAISSLIIYISASLYIIWQIYQWQTDQFLPTIVQTNGISNQLMFICNQIEIDFDYRNKLSFDVFDANRTIFIPKINPYCSTNLCTQLFQNQQFEQIMENNTYIMKNLNITNQISSDTISDYYIQFNLCNNMTSLDYTNECATNDQIDEYFNKSSWIQIKINFSQYDVQTKSILSYKKSHWLKINKTKSFYTQINLMAGFTQVDDGIVLSTQTNHNYIASADIIIQEAYDEIYPFALDIFLDEQYHSQNIQYPMLGSVLANAGSIVSLIFWFSYLVQKFNQISLEKFLMNEIIGFYYPEFKQITIQRKWYNNNDVKVYSKDGKKEYEPNKLIKIYKNASQIAIEKLSILNIVYELSRIQFILQSLQDREFFQQSRNLGIQLPLEVMQKQRLKIIPDQRTTRIQSKTHIDVQNSLEIISKNNSGLIIIQNPDQNFISSNSKNNLLKQDQSQRNYFQDQQVEKNNLEMINKDNNLRNNEIDPQIINDSDVNMIDCKIGFD